MSARFLMAATAALFSAQPLAAQQATARFIDASGGSAGNAELTTAPGGVLIRVEITGLPPQSWLAFHIHETGSCDPDTGHESAGGHFNPTATEHGYLSATGPHAGDLPNLWSDAEWSDAEGVARAEVFSPFVVLTEGENSARGRALMVHAGPDDYQTQPSGGAGDRLACAVIE